MEMMKLKLEHLHFLLPMPEEARKEAEEFLGMADVVPLALTINGDKFVIMKEESYEELLTLDETEEDFYDSEYESTYGKEVTEEELGYATVSLVLDLLEDVALTTEQLSHLEEIIAAYQLLATAREIYGGEEQ